MVPIRRRPTEGTERIVQSRAVTGTLAAMPFGIGIWELLILLLVLLLVFGPKRLPEMGRQLGKGMREFKDSVSGKDPPEDDYTAELPPAQPASTTAPAAERETVS
jgi:sec-independent protein translocase protein TatA